MRGKELFGAKLPRKRISQANNMFEESLKGVPATQKLTVRRGLDLTTMTKESFLQRASSAHDQNEWWPMNVIDMNMAPHTLDGDCLSVPDVVRFVL